MPMSQHTANSWKYHRHRGRGFKARQMAESQRLTRLTISECLCAGDGYGNTRPIGRSNLAREARQDHRRRHRPSSLHPRAREYDNDNHPVVATATPISNILWIALKTQRRTSGRALFEQNPGLEALTGQCFPAGVMIEIPHLAQTKAAETVTKYGTKQQPFQVTKAKAPPMWAFYYLADAHHATLIL